MEPLTRSLLKLIKANVIRRPPRLPNFLRVVAISDIHLKPISEAEVVSAGSYLLPFWPSSRDLAVEC
jgi:hypothetical protein